MKAAAVLAGALAALGVAPAPANTNGVASSRAAVFVRPIYPNDLKPSECAAVYPVELVVGAGTIKGGPGPDLILGSSGDDWIQAKNGEDCVVAGGGDDEIDGGPGTDVCIGGPGTDVFDKCETVWP